MDSVVGFDGFEGSALVSVAVAEDVGVSSVFELSPTPRPTPSPITNRASTNTRIRKALRGKLQILREAWDSRSGRPGGSSSCTNGPATSFSGCCALWCGLHGFFLGLNYLRAIGAVEIDLETGL